MEQYINKLEFALLQEIIKNHSVIKETDYLLKHLLFIQVKNREFTGVGIYVNFKYCINTLKIDTNLNLSLSSSKTLKFNSFDEDFSFELDVSNGKINYLEIVTYKSGWDGKYEFFEFEE